mmetsp:Transcript_9759/g.23622  ORF Transcript_9759/g.23622 Transcript_9759/m.23622 type:complete len:683 (-) Transcript_9759:58-2106(-)
MTLPVFDKNLNGMGWNQRGMTAAAEKNARAMWIFLTRRYNRNKSKMRTISDGGSVSSSNYDPLDDDDDLSRMSMTSTEMNAIAVPPTNQTVEDSLSQELMKLSMNDRQAVEEEIHGVHCMCNFNETPEFLRQKLHEFDIELNAIKNSERRRRKRARARRQQQQSKKNGGGSFSGGDEDVLRNVIGIRDFLKVVDEEENTECTVETAQSRSSFGSIATAFPEGMEVDESELKKRSCWVNDPAVRLRFLRCELFFTKKAVKRFVTFLDFAQELYGDFIADRPMRLSDMKTREEKRAMANMQFHVLPFRDRSGRRVFVSVGSCGYDVEPRMRIKILWYMIWIASEDIETQRKGLVIIGWPCDEIISGSMSNNPMSEDDTRSSDGSAMGGMEDSAWERNLRPNIANMEGIYQVKAVDGLPIRIAALHFCIQNRPIYRILNSLFYFTLDSTYKSRYKVHIGEPLEIRYKLQGYGIPVDLLPITHTMTLKRQSHLQWINFRKYVEQGVNGNAKTNSKNKASLTIDPQDIVDCPRSYDVIIGKAKYTNNPGNVFYRSLIEATHDEHISLSKRDKVEMTWRIVRQMEEMNGRFLEMNKHLKVWVHIKDRNVMRQKVAQSYKEYKRNAHVVRTKRQQEQQEKTYCGDKRQRTDETSAIPVVHESSCLKGCRRRCNEHGYDSLHPSSLFTGM